MTVVVLSGMIGSTKTKNGYVPEWGDATDRFFGGIELIKASKANQLIFTGAKMPWTKGTETEGEILKKFAIAFGIPDSNIKITGVVETTEDESKAVGKLLGANKKIILVTSAYHMYRAKRLFEKENIKVISYPVDFKTNQDETTLIDFFPTADSLSTTELAIREMMGRCFYWVRSLLS